MGKFDDMQDDLPWAAKAAPVVSKRGPRRAETARGKQKTYLRLLQCDACGFKARATIGAIDKAGGPPRCACNRKPLTIHLPGEQ